MPAVCLAYLSEEKDAFAQNMKYHINCLRTETRLMCLSTSTTDASTENENFCKAVCDVEIAQIVECIINSDTSSEFPSIDMNSVENAYKLLLKEQGVENHPKSSYKKHKKVLLEKVPGIDFAKRGPKSEVIFSTVTKERSMTHTLYENDRDEMETVFKAF